MMGALSAATELVRALEEAELVRQELRDETDVCRRRAEELERALLNRLEAERPGSGSSEAEMIKLRLETRVTFSSERLLSMTHERQTSYTRSLRLATAMSDADDALFRLAMCPEVREPAEHIRNLIRAIRIHDVGLAPEDATDDANLADFTERAAERVRQLHVLDETLQQTRVELASDFLQQLRPSHEKITARLDEAMRERDRLFSEALEIARNLAASLERPA